MRKTREEKVKEVYEKHWKDKIVLLRTGHFGKVVGYDEDYNNSRGWIYSLLIELKVDGLVIDVNVDDILGKAV